LLDAEGWAGRVFSFFFWTTALRAITAISLGSFAESWERKVGSARWNGILGAGPGAGSSLAGLGDPGGARI